MKEYKKHLKKDVNEARKEYKRIKYVSKDVVKRKKECQKEFHRRLSDDFRSNIKLFRKSRRTARGQIATSQLRKIRRSEETKTEVK